MVNIADRKSEHLDVVLSGVAAAPPGSAGFDAVRFAHVALPEMRLDDVDLSTTFIGRRLAAPFLVSSMTGGPARAEAINLAIAEAAGTLGIAFGVGSQRVALESAGAAGFDRRLRARAGPNVPILANFGAAQLRNWDGLAMAERAIDMIDADALIIHLNPLQEAVQAGGDRDWSGLLGHIEAIARRLSKPIVVKEVGSGIGATVARRLFAAGVGIIDVAGHGGTNWASVEGARAGDSELAAVAAAFRDWGIPTARAIVDVRAACPGAVVIASGGIRDGVEAAKAIRLGADMIGQAAGVLQAAIDGPEALVRHFTIVIAQMRIACFCTGSADLAALRSAELVGSSVTAGA